MIEQLQKENERKNAIIRGLKVVVCWLVAALCFVLTLALGLSGGR